MKTKSILAFSALLNAILAVRLQQLEVSLAKRCAGCCAENPVRDYGSDETTSLRGGDTTSGEHVDDQQREFESRFSGEKIRSYSGSKKLFLASNDGDKEVQNPFTGTTIASVGDCNQWAVVTTIREPDDSINGVAKLKGWCLVIVADTKTNDAAYESLSKNSNVIYLSIDDQKKHLVDKIPFVKSMPFDSVARKNIGYLYAVASGAKVIYDFDDDNVLQALEDGVTVLPPFLYKKDSNFDGSLLFKMRLPPSGNGTSYKEKNNGMLSFNPCLHMGPYELPSWPRGYPMDHVTEAYTKASEMEFTFGSLPYSSVGVLQSLSNGDPDFDAVYRMTQRNWSPYNFAKDKRRTKLLIPLDAYTPYNAEATTHLYHAFWGLYLPITVTDRVSDIWRSYFAQRIMKDIGLHVVYTPPIVNHGRSTRDYLADFADEADLYKKTSKLLVFLDSWESTKDSLPERILDLWIALYEHEYIAIADVEAVKQWLAALTSAGYKFPEIIPSSTVRQPEVQPHLEEQPYRPGSIFHVNGAGQTYWAYAENNSNPTKAEWMMTYDWNKRPKDAILKLILMTMDEFPLIKDWVFYHGKIIGFENLYIIDGSTDNRNISFLQYARDILGANVVFSDADLNHIPRLMTDIGGKISGSCDFIIKVDTDEFLTVYDEDAQTLTAGITEYLSGYASNPDHPLRKNIGRRIGYQQASMPSEEVCAQDAYSRIGKFPLSEIRTLPADDWYKSVYDSESIYLGNGGIQINLGAHVLQPQTNQGTTRFGIIHFHYRCVEIEIENCKRVLERHYFINPSQTDEAVKKTLLKKLGWKAKHDYCNVKREAKSFVSFHKAVFYVKWLTCPEQMKSEYYSSDVSQGTFNSHLHSTLEASTEENGL